MFFSYSYAIFLQIFNLYTPHEIMSQVMTTFSKSTYIPS